jgi:NADPH:quinone reductase-like Zn-dependent oxidoreductase
LRTNATQRNLQTIEKRCFAVNARILETSVARTAFSKLERSQIADQCMRDFSGSVGSMTLTSKIGSAVVVLIVVALASLAFALSHDSAPAPAQILPSDVIRMKAIVHRQYGSPDVLRLEVVEKPTPAHDGLLIRVRAASVNPLDWHYMRGKPYVMRMQAGMGRPKFTRLGVDFSGTVEAVGQEVKLFKVGDEIFGTADGALAEYVTSTEAGLALKPTNMTFQQAASVPIAGITALQGLRDKGRLQPGQKVLINGASGGVGTFAVQIAKSLGAEVTGVCSTGNVEMVRSIGADHVIDYTKEDYTKGTQRYDLIFDTVGNHSLSDHRHVLDPHGILVIVGAVSDDPWIGPLSRFLEGYVISPFVSQKFVGFIADANKTDDLNTLRDLMQAGALTPVIDRQYSLSEVPAAIRYLENGHARGKLVITVE